MDPNERLDISDYPAAKYMEKLEKFWNENHPPEGIVPSKNGIRAKKMSIGQWCWDKTEEQWTRRINGLGPTAFCVLFSGVNSGPHEIGNEDLLYPSETEDELKEKLEPCPKCGHTQWNYDETNPDRSPYWYCNFCGLDRLEHEKPRYEVELPIKQ